MIRVILIISLATVASARHHPNRASPDESEKPHNLGWLFSEVPQHVESASSESKSERSICHTEECHLIAKKILESMNKSANPCEDFYEYTCGNWVKHNKPVTEDAYIWNNMWKLNTQIMADIKDLVASPAKPDDTLSVRLMKKWYDTCMDKDRIEKSELEPLLSTLERIGGWPITMEPLTWDEDIYKWQKVDDYYARLSGENVFYNLKANEVGGKMVLVVDTPTFPPGKEVFFRILRSIDDDDDEDESGDKDDDDDDDDDGSDGDSEDEDTTENIIEDDSVSEEINERTIRVTKEKRSRRNKTNNVDENETVMKTVKRKTKQVAHKNKIGATKKKSGHNKVEKSDHVRKEAHKLLKKRAKRSLLSNIVRHHVKNHGLIKHKKKITEKKGLKEERLDKLNSDEIESTTESTNEENNDEDSDEDDEMSKIEQYYEYISRVVIAFAEETGSDVDLDDLHNDVSDIIRFQLDLQKIVLKNSKDRENITLEKFQEWYDNLKGDSLNSKVNWIEKIEDLFSEANVDMDSSEVSIVNTEYFKDLKILLEETSSRTIVNYVHWFFASRMLITSTKKMRDLYNKWDENDESNPFAMHSRCTQERKIRQIVAYLYVKKYFTDDMQKYASDMCDDVQKEMEYQIKKAEWMDEETRDFILSKLVHIKKLIGYPNWYNNETFVERYLQGITIGSSYFENMLNYDRSSKWNVLRQIVNKSAGISGEFPISPITLNAMFSADENTILITAVDFHSPMFAFNRPNTVNFASIGSFVAHEVNHGFDKSGYNVDKNGNKVELVAEMAKAYGKRAECFVHQYNKYGQDLTSNKIQNHGNWTLDENIADTMGLQAVYKAYKRRQRECGKDDDALPGMENFSNDQIFFLSYGYTWCEWLNPKVQVSAMKTDHSIGRLRLIGSVSNLEEFANAFNCPVDSPMNPKKKCNIWM